MTTSTAMALTWMFAIPLLAVPVAALSQEKNDGYEQVHVAAATTETLIMFRHGEKPPARLGQLTCQGLNRALALPSVLMGKFGKADVMFASNPSVRLREGTGEYSYVRPLATIEPTAIQAGLPVNTQFGYKEIDALRQELSLPLYLDKQVYIAWEHRQLNLFAKSVLQAHGGNPDQVPDWPTQDYDRIYVIKIERKYGQSTASFSVEQQGLNGLPTTCPVLPGAGR